MKIKFRFFLAATLVGLVSSSSFAGDVNRPPELWSWFKDLNKSADACQIQSSFILDKLKITDRVENENGIYGVYKTNRIVVKCLAQGEKSKLMVAVAGHDRDSVELLRNLIIKEIN